MKWKYLFLVVIFCILFTGCTPMDSFFKKPQSSDKDKQVQTNRENKTKKQNFITLNEIFFNDIKEVNGKDIIQNPSNVLALINKQFFLPDTYIPSGLMRPNVAFAFGNVQVEKAFLRKDAADALTKMFNQAKKEGIELFAVSGYRSFVRQKAVFDAEVTRSGKDNAVKAVAIPGASEHQSGLAMDISSQSNHLELNEAFSATEEGKWLEANAHRFGFILRYPKGKEGLTHYEYEPWHFRYVGVKAATIIYQHQWTLEEYFNEVKKV